MSSAVGSEALVRETAEDNENLRTCVSFRYSPDEHTAGWRFGGSIAIGDCERGAAYCDGVSGPP